MSDVAIRVDNLSKTYRIGSLQNGDQQFGYRSLRDVLTTAIASPLRSAKGLLGGDAYAASDMNETLWALKDISFKIKPGEVVGVIGRNGAGKSTLLKILSRITEPTHGEATIYGRVGSLLEVGTGFHPELTGRENIFLNGAILGMRRAEIVRQFDEIVAFAEVDKFIDTPVKHYSSGMYLRLAFAVAAHLEPEILLVDEVLAVGDAAFQKKCLGKMEDVAREGRTVLFVSHNMGAMLELTQRCVLLQGGESIYDGPTYEAVQHYLRDEKHGVLAQDLSQVARQGAGSERWRITHIKITNAQNGKVRHGTPLEIALSYYSEEALDEVLIGFGILNMFGARLISCESTDAAFTLSTQAKESGCVRITLEMLPLTTGQYTIEVGARQGAAHGLDYVGEALVFEVEEDLEDVWRLNRQGLGCRLPSTWKKYDLNKVNS